MASVSIAARESLRVSTVCLVNSQARSLAVRKVHFLPMRTRLTPRGAYSALRRAKASLSSTPFGNCRASVASSSGSPAANSNASSRRNSSGRASAAALSSASGGGSSFGTMASFLATLGIAVSLGVFLRVMRGHNSVRADTLAHVDRRERLLLMNLGQPLAHQFERGGKGRGEDGRRQRRLDHIRDQELVEPRPVGRLPDQPLERAARFGERPHFALLEAHVREFAARALRGVSAEQIVERRRPF